MTYSAYLMQSHESRAKEYRAERDRGYSRSRADAKRAAHWYELAARMRTQGRWLTRRSDLWDPEEEFTPAAMETAARTYERVADMYSRSSFHNMEHARTYGELARKALGKE